MSKTTIYLVTTYDGHDGYDPIIAYTCEADAIAFQALCNDYDKTHPTAAVNTSDLEAQRVAWEKHADEIEVWREGHPAGYDFAPYGPFEIKPIHLYS